MTSARRLIAAAVGGVVLFSAALSVAPAQDWPQWRGANRDGKAAGFVAPKEWPKELKSVWKVKVGEGDSTPALVGDKLYVFARQGGDEVTLCLNAADGKEVWNNKFAVAAISGPSARAHTGPRSSPTVADGKVVTLGVTGVLTCLNAADGKLVWRNEEFKSAPRFFTASSPMIVDGMVVAQLGGSKDGVIAAFNLADGKEKWKLADEPPAYASPVLMTVDGVKQLVTLTEKSVVGVGLADGKRLWEVPFAAQGMAYNAATPIVDGQTVYITGQGRGTKALKVEKTDGGFAAKELWSSNKDLAVQFNTPVLKDGMLFGLSEKGNLFCLDAKTGAEGWADSAKYDKFGEIVDAGGVLMALPSSQAELVVFKPAAKQYEQLAKIKVADTSTFAYPVVAGKRIFVKDQDSLAMFAVE